VTDLLERGDLDEDSVPEDEDDSAGVQSALPLSEDLCQYIDEHGERCVLFLPAGHNPSRKYCDGHQRGGHLLRTGKRGRPRKDVPPVNVNVKLGGAKSPKLEPDQQRVQEAASAWLGLVAGVLEASGDKVCADATKEAAPQIALQLALLAKFHPMIVKVLAPIEASGEALIWVSLLVATSPLIITVLAHHKVISEEVASRIGIVTAMGAVVGAQSQSEAEAA
jgi:hypothetical protein